MKVTDLTKKKKQLKLNYFLDFDGVFKKETENLQELLSQAKEVILIDKNHKVTIDDINEFDLIYIKFKDDSEFFNNLYLGFWNDGILTK